MSKRLEHGRGESSRDNRRRNSRRRGPHNHESMTFPKWMRILGLVALVAGTLITAKYFADQFTQSSEVQATQTAGSEAILYMTEEEFLNDPINQRYAEGLRLLLG